MEGKAGNDEGETGSDEQWREMRGSMRNRGSDEEWREKQGVKMNGGRTGSHEV